MVTHSSKEHFDDMPSVGLKNSRRRNAVLKAFSSAGEHLTIDEVYERAKKIDPKTGYTTVWRTMKLLTSMGLAAAQKFHDGQMRFEQMKPAGHHDHMICIRCGKVQEFLNPKIEDIQQHMATRHKFIITNHKLELYGYCGNCREK